MSYDAHADLDDLVYLDLKMPELTEGQLKPIEQADWYNPPNRAYVFVPGPQINWMTRTSPSTVGIDVHTTKLELVTHRQKLLMLGEALNEVGREERAELKRNIKVLNRWNAILGAFALALLILLARVLVRKV